MEENPRAGLQDEESDVEIEYDEDGNPIAPKKSKVSLLLILLFIDFSQNCVCCYIFIRDVLHLSVKYIQLSVNNLFVQS